MSEQLQQPQIVFPQVPKTEAANFAKVWKNPAGLTMILDDTTLQFATDFANIVLRSFIVQQMQIAAMKHAAAAAQQQGTGPKEVNQTNAVSQQQTPAPKPSGIILAG